MSVRARACKFAFPTELVIQTILYERTIQMNKNVFRPNYGYCAGIVFAMAVLPSIKAQSVMGKPARGEKPGLSLSGSMVSFNLPGFRPGRNGARGPEVFLHDFSFDGKAVPADTLHLQTLGEGAYELTGNAATVGEWKFKVDDSADGYYGLGERSTRSTPRTRSFVTTLRTTP
jgi:hypothetical protein